MFESGLRQEAHGDAGATLARTKIAIGLGGMGWGMLVVVYITQADGCYNPVRKLWESWPEAVRVLARGRARGIFPGPNPSEPQVGVLARGGVRGKILLAGVC